MRIAILLCVILLLNSCSGQQDTEIKNDSVNHATDSVAAFSLKQASSKCISALQTGDIKSLSAFIHPEGCSIGFNCRISEGVVFSATSLLSSFENDTIINWGAHPSSGEEMKSTLRELLHQYFQNVNYVNADSVLLNNCRTRGNQQCKFKLNTEICVEYFVNGKDPKFDGMDWNSTYLIFSSDTANPKLRAILHGQWSI